MTGGERVPGQMLDAAERRLRVAEMRRSGATFVAIGKELGCSPQRAREIYRQIVAKVMRRDHQVVNQGRVIREVVGTYPDVDEHGRPHPLAGQPIYGDPLVDDGPKLDAARTLTTIQAREMKLVGGDAPTRTEMEGVHRVRYEVVGIDPGELL